MLQMQLSKKKKHAISTYFVSHVLRNAKLMSHSLIQTSEVHK